MRSWLARVETPLWESHLDSCLSILLILMENRSSDCFKLAGRFPPDKIVAMDREVKAWMNEPDTCPSPSALSSSSHITSFSQPRRGRRTFKEEVSNLGIQGLKEKKANLGTESKNLKERRVGLNKEITAAKAYVSKSRPQDVF